MANLRPSGKSFLRFQRTLANSFDLGHAVIPFYVPRRFRYKPKWAENRKPRGPRQLALANFDAFYKPVYGDNWPLIRLSLLSLPKYCAVVNKYADPDKVQDKFKDLGAQDFVRKARSLLNIAQQSETSTNSESSSNQHLSPNTELNHPEIDDTSQTVEKDQKLNNPLNSEEEAMYDEFYKDNIDVFVPTMKVISEKEELMKQEISVSSFEPRDVEVSIQEGPLPSISNDVSAAVFPSGDVSRFPPTRPYNRRLGYYLMDPASVLPVLALSVQPTDIVLDLCAAPGGKSVVILQSLNLSEGGHLHCNEFARARMERLKEVLNSYFPRDVTEELKLTQMDGVVPVPPIYNKVLVDVPCNADRHVLNEEDNNLFQPVRTKERLGLMSLQTKLLISGIKSCAVGGDIVYSTCTLAPAQNDGVIQAAVEKLAETTQIEVVVQDLSNFVKFFQESFTFFDRSKYGQTVLPDLMNNSGPTYFAKLKRVK